MSDRRHPTAADAARLHADLAAIWANRPGLGALSAVNHGTIGLRFIATGFAFMLVGGLLAMFIRLQLAWPGNTVLDPQRYAELVTMHGTTMMFLFAVPIMEGFALYLIPKMLGARDMPFPRLSAYGYWCYLFGGLLLYASFLFDAVPRGGWFMYVPLSGREFTPDISADFWLLGVTFAEISAVAAAVELVVAIMITRAPGMAIQRMPLFAWYILATSLMIVFGFPPLIVGSILLEIERATGMVFFDPARGGDPLLWQHLFWLFGHPEVYIVFLPAAGVLSTLIPTFARRPMVGYSWVVLAVLGMAFLSFGLWVHHMFTVGIPLLSLGFFSAASMAVAIPTGIQVFAWIATLWSGRPELRVPMLYVLGFFFVFVLGGLTGVMVAFVPFDWQVHDSHFVVAHLHYVLIGGLMFPLFAAFYYWLPLWSGRMSQRSTAGAAFWLIFIGFNLTFLPMHLTGMLGLPRRVYTYSSDLGVDVLNMLSTVGGFLFAFGVGAFMLDLLLGWRHGVRAAQANPWQASTLEWSLPVPPPNYNFAGVPAVASRDPLWDEPRLPKLIAFGERYLGIARDGAREMLGTSPLDGRPEQVIRLSNSSWWPLAAALATAASFIGVLGSFYLLALLALAVAIGCFVGWAWSTGDRRAPDRLEAGGGLRLPTQYAAHNAPGWWGLAVFLCADATAFAALLFGYVYLWLSAEAWPPAGWPPPAAGPALLFAALLVASSAAIGLARASLRRARLFRRWFGAGLGLGLLALALAGWILLDGLPPPTAHAYASVSASVLGFAWLHVALAWLVALFVAERHRRGWVDAGRPLELRVAQVLWNYAVVVAVLAIALLVLFPRVL